MATAQQPVQSSKTQESLISLIAANRKKSGYAFIASGVVLAVLPLWLGFAYKSEYWAVCVTTALLALVPLGAGSWQLLRAPGQVAEADLARMLLLTAGGLFGLCLVLVAGALAYEWWDTVLGGMEKWQGEGGWHLWACIAVLLLGLGLLFASLQLGRSLERSNPALRRLIYGFNALLTGLLLVAILTVINVLASIHLTNDYDWTTKNIYSLGSRSEQILENLVKPTKIYVILAKGTDWLLYQRVTALLSNCRAVNDKIQVEYLSPDAGRDRDRIKQLQRQCNFSERQGLLVVYGAEPRADDSIFVGVRSLKTGGSPATNMGENRDRRLFRGESALMSAIRFLEEGKQKPVVYFTQGNGELDLDDTQSEEPGAGAGLLKQRLEADNFTVRGLQLTAVQGARSNRPDLVVANEVPADATVVVVAGPERMPAPVIGALQKYTKANGKLVVLAGPPPPERADSQDLGRLDKFLRAFSVQLGNNRVLQYNDVDPRMVLILTNPTDDFRKRNVIASVFNQQPFLFYDVRTAEPVLASTQESKDYQAAALMLGVPTNLWAETDLRIDPATFLEPKAQAGLAAKLSSEPLPVAVAVTEGGAVNPHTGTALEEEKPAMAVFGCSSFVSNRLLQSQGPAGHGYDLFVSTLGWLRKNPADIGIEPKKQDYYVLNPAKVDRGRLILLPAILMIVGIVGLGTGVWLVRRR